MKSSLKYEEIGDFNYSYMMVAKISFFEVSSEKRDSLVPINWCEIGGFLRRCLLSLKKGA